MKFRKTERVLMKRMHDWGIDFSTGFLSAFDLSGLLALSKLDYGASGIQQDMQHLQNDLNTIEDDHLKAIEKLTGNSNGHPED